jgi:hypothetical protein
MQVKDLDGNLVNWQLIGNIVHGQIDKKSSLHLKAREIIHKCFPTFQVLEEVSIPVKKLETLYMDFYLPLTKTCIEVHGEQHYEFNRFFHKSILGFMKHKKRDQNKKEWCSINNIKYIELPYDKIDMWEELIKNEY